MTVGRGSWGRPWRVVPPLTTTALSGRAGTGDVLRPRLLTPEIQRACAPLVLRVAGLRPRAPVRIRASTTDRSGRTWRAEAMFRSSDTVVDIARDAAVAGDYRGIDPDGLVTHMRPVGGLRPDRRRFVPASSRVLTVGLEVRVPGGSVLTKTISRVLVGSDVTVRPIMLAAAVVGAVWLPPQDDARRPLVVVLGPRSSLLAAYAPGLLASRGYPTARVVPARRHLPSWLNSGGYRASLDRLEGTLGYVADDLGLDTRGVVLLGVGGGAELAVRAAADLPGVGAVATWPPGVRSSSGQRASRRWHGRATESRSTRRILRAGPGRLPGDARAGVDGGGDAWDHLLHLLRGLSIEQGPVEDA